MNAFKVDNDGNILASFRNHSEIMKIDRNNGEIIWRMGSPRGEFTFVGEHEENAPYYFARQHNVERLPNGHLTVFDNGEFHSPPYSRAVEYSLDEENKVATMVSEYRYQDGNIIAALAGNAQRPDNGGWFICYGGINPMSSVKRNVVEVDGDSKVTFELSLPPGVLAYRVNKALWKSQVKLPTVTHFEVTQGQTVTFDDSSNVTGVTIYFEELSAYGYNQVDITRYPYGPLDPRFFGELPKIFRFHSDTPISLSPRINHS